MSKPYTIEVGTWHETAAREITRCPSYYAADTETLRTEPGDYPVRVTLEGGYRTPMPYWVLVGIDAERVDGRLYSGFGGVNYASTELPKGEKVQHTIQTYLFDLRRLAAEGKVTVKPEYRWILDEKPWENEAAPKTWDEARAMVA